MGKVVRIHLVKVKVSTSLKEMWTEMMLQTTGSSRAGTSLLQVNVFRRLQRFRLTALLFSCIFQHWLWKRSPPAQSS